MPLLRPSTRLGLDSVHAASRGWLNRLEVAALSSDYPKKHKALLPGNRKNKHKKAPPNFNLLPKLRMESVPSFSYDSLPGPSSFRLLTLLPSAANPEQLECCLDTHHDLHSENTPAYEALSYVWGDPRKAGSIICNGGSLGITSSLAIALRRLRLTTPRKLWIDQLCVNQDDSDEQSHQVGMMRDIYANAQHVVLWAGPDPEGRAFAARGILARLSELFVDWVRAGLPKSKYQAFPRDLALAELGLPPRQAPAWEHLESMFSLPYFERIWIIQEVPAARSATFLWGDVEIAWCTIARACVFALPDSSCVSDGLNSNEARVRLPATQINTLFLPYDRSYSWEDFLYSTSTFKSTDPRDRFFALSGLVSDGSAVVVDYSKPTNEIFAQAVTGIIRSSQNLRIPLPRWVENRNQSLQ
jgi:hypothetical protein